MRVFFNDLPQPVRERFLRVATSKPPQAVLSATHGYATWFPPVAAVLALAGAGWAMVFLFGEAQYKAPWYDREIYLALAGAVFVFVASVATFGFNLIWKKPPYPKGTYLFPSYLCVVHGPDLDVVPLSGIARPTVTHRYRNGVYQGSTLGLQGTGQDSRVQGSFWFRTQEEATKSAETFFATRDRIAKVLASRDTAALAQIDPFYECTTSGQWTEPPAVAKQGPLVDRRHPAAGWVRWIGAVVIGLGFAGVFYLGMVLLCQNSASALKRCRDARSRSGECCY